MCLSVDFIGSTPSQGYYGVVPLLAQVFTLPFGSAKLGKELELNILFVNKP